MGATVSVVETGAPVELTLSTPRRESRSGASGGRSLRPVPAPEAITLEATVTRCLAGEPRADCSGTNVLLYAHRGSSGKAPENTLAAFRRAIADGADGVELDVRATADGVPVVLHDRDLSRTTSACGWVDGLPLAEVRRCDAGDGEPVPTLAEVLDLLAGRIRLDLELKQAGVECAVLGLLAARPWVRWAISSFDWGVLRTVRALAPDAELWPLAVTAGEDLAAVAGEIGAGGVALAAAGIDAAVADRYAAVGLPVIAWTVNDPAEARRLRDLGVTAVCTDLPVALRRALAPTPDDQRLLPTRAFGGAATRSLLGREGSGGWATVRAPEGEPAPRPRVATRDLAAGR